MKKFLVILAILSLTIAGCGGSSGSGGSSASSSNSSGDRLVAVHVNNSSGSPISMSVGGPPIAPHGWEIRAQFNASDEVEKIEMVNASSEVMEIYEYTYTANEDVNTRISVDPISLVDWYERDHSYNPLFQRTRTDNYTITYPSGVRTKTHNTYVSYTYNGNGLLETAQKRAGDDNPFITPGTLVRDVTYEYYSSGPFMGYIQKVTRIVNCHTTPYEYYDLYTYEISGDTLITTIEYTDQDSGDRGHMEIEFDIPNDRVLQEDWYDSSGSITQSNSYTYETGEGSGESNDWFIKLQEDNNLISVVE